jgi:hypothetical protein
MLVFLATAKNDPEGKNKADGRSVFSNVFEPEIDVMVSLSLLFMQTEFKPEGWEKQKLFPGE